MQTRCARDHSFAACLQSAPAVVLAAAVPFSFWLAPLKVWGSDVSSCFVRQVQGFNQTSSAMPVWRTPYPFAFQADAYVDSSNALNEAMIVMPDGSLLSLSWDPVHSYRPTSYSFRENFPSAESLNDAFTNGVHTFFLNTAHEGYRAIALELVTPDYPNAPWVSNFDDTQQVKADADFVLQWNPFIGGTTNDSIVVEIWSDPSTRSFTTPGDGQFIWTNRSVVVPRNTLRDGQTCVVFLVFMRITDTDSSGYPGVMGKAGCDTYTLFQLRTLPQLHIGVSNLIATLSWPSPSTGFVLQANADAGQSGGWMTMTNTPVLAGDSYTVSLAATNRTQFYRLTRN